MTASRRDRRRSSCSPLLKMSHRLAGDVVRGYAANVKLVEALGKAYGFRPLFVWQPVIFFKSSLFRSRRKRAPSTAGRRPCSRTSEPMISQEKQLTSDPAFINLCEIFKDTTALVFLDFCHTTEEANAKIAAEIVPRLIEAGSRPRPRSRLAVRQAPQAAVYRGSRRRENRASNAQAATAEVVSTCVIRWTRSGAGAFADTASVSTQRFRYVHNDQDPIVRTYTAIRALVVACATTASASSPRRYSAIA